MLVADIVLLDVCLVALNKVEVFVNKVVVVLV